MMPTRIIILGAAGRDFHNFNVVYRHDPEVHVVAFTQVLGHQQGLTIGVVNFARSLNGVQVGVINIVRDNPAGRKVLPLINWGSTKR